MTEKRKVELLARLRVWHDQKERPSLREAEMTEDEKLEMESDGLLDFGDAQKEDVLDRYIVYSILPKGWLLLDSKRDRVYAPPASLSSKILHSAGGKLWDLVWDVAKFACGIVVGWFLKKYLP